MTEEKKKRIRKAYITQPCRLVLPDGAVAEVTIRVPEASARALHWQITSESVLITVDESTLEKSEPSVMRRAAGEMVAPTSDTRPTNFHSSAAAQDDIAADPELAAAKERGASVEEVEAILESRRMAAPPLQLASTRGQEIARQAAGLRRISVDVDGEHIEHELSASGGVK